MVKIEGEHMRPVTWVIIEEVRSGEWGIGGQPMTTKAVVALANGKGYLHRQCRVAFRDLFAFRP